MVAYLGQHWMVHRYDPKRTRTATLVSAEGASTEVACKAANHDCLVLCNPSVDWPFLVIPERHALGPIKGFQLLREGKANPLTVFQDWVASDPLHPGGAIFFAPTLNLQYGETLLVERERGNRALRIPANFTTVQAKIQRAQKPVKTERTMYDRLLEDDEL